MKYTLCIYFFFVLFVVFSQATYLVTYEHKNDLPESIDYSSTYSCFVLGNGYLYSTTNNGFALLKVCNGTGLLNIALGFSGSATPFASALGTVLPNNVPLVTTGVAVDDSRRYIYLALSTPKSLVPSSSLQISYFAVFDMTINAITKVVYLNDATGGKNVSANHLDFDNDRNVYITDVRGRVLKVSNYQTVSVLIESDLLKPHTIPISINTQSGVAGIACVRSASILVVSNANTGQFYKITLNPVSIALINSSNTIFPGQDKVDEIIHGAGVNPQEHPTAVVLQSDNTLIFLVDNAGVTRLAKVSTADVFGTVTIVSTAQSVIIGGTDVVAINGEVFISHAPLAPLTAESGNIDQAFFMAAPN